MLEHKQVCQQNTETSEKPADTRDTLPRHVAEE